LLAKKYVLFTIYSELRKENPDALPELKDSFADPTTDLHRTKGAIEMMRLYVALSYASKEKIKGIIGRISAGNIGDNREKYLKHIVWEVAYPLMKQTDVFERRGYEGLKRPHS